MSDHAQPGRIDSSVGQDLEQAMFTPFPPVRSGLRLAAKLRAAGGLRLARNLALRVRRLADEEFRGEGGLLLLAGNALHAAGLAPEAVRSGGFGWLMSMVRRPVGDRRVRGPVRAPVIRRSPLGNHPEGASARSGATAECGGWRGHRRTRAPRSGAPGARARGVTRPGRPTARRSLQLAKLFASANGVVCPCLPRGSPVPPGVPGSQGCPGDLQ